MNIHIDLKRHAGKLALFSLVFVLVAYLLFNWTMSAIIHAKKEVMIPDLKGKSLTEAVVLLSPLNVGIRKEGEEPDQSLPAGTIIRQNPLSGMAVREGKIIRVTVSQGGSVIYVPDVVRQAVRTAEIAIRSAGLAVGEESSRFSLVFKKDQVIDQDPPAGAIAEKDAMVNLVISAGPPSGNVRLMPDFRGKNLAEAQGWAEKSGIAVDLQQESAAAVAPGTIIRQKPAPDSDISSAAGVTFTVAGEAVAPVAGEQSRIFHYEIPQGGGPRQVRLTLFDDNGETEIFHGSREPGTKLDIPVSTKGSSRVRVFINSILVEEREIK